MNQPDVITRLAAAELRDLADTAATCWPAGGTCCDGWDSTRLVEHVTIRTSGPVGFVASAAKLDYHLPSRLRGRRNRDRYRELIRSVQRQRRRYRWHDLVEALVHHEDLRRTSAKWLPRDPDPELDATIASLLPQIAKRRLTGHVAVEGDELSTTLYIGGGPSSGEVRGHPIEVLLWIYGRPSMATKFEPSVDCGEADVHS